MRYVIDLGSGNAGTSPAFLHFQRLDTLAELTPPALVEIGAGRFYFDLDWSTVPAGVTAITWKIVGANLTEFSDVILGAGSATSIPGTAGSGQDTLAGLREKVRQRTDTENDPHITDDEVRDWLNGGLAELYDLLVTRYGEEYYTATADITTDGASDRYSLPDGSLYGGAPAFYKGSLVELAVPGPQKWATLHRFNLGEKNRFQIPQYVTTAGLVNLRYRLQGSTLMLAPLPTAGQKLRLWYAPRMAPLVADTDIADGVSGWLDYAVADACVKVCGKQERDPSLFLAQKAALAARIETAAQNRDPGEPATVTVTEQDDFMGGAFGIPPWGVPY